MCGCPGFRFHAWTNRVFAIGLSVLALPWAAGQTQESSPPLDEFRAIAARADSMYFDGQPAAALSVCKAAIASGHEDAGLHWRAARAAIALGMLNDTIAERKALYQSAVGHARLAVSSAPQDLEARYWLAASAGRRASKGEIALSVRLAHEVYEHATAILAADSNHAAAHHALGMLHAEVLRVPRFVRFVIARAMRAAVMDRASWSQAEQHLLRAVELEPGMILYLSDLADVYGRAGRTTEAMDLARRIAATEPRHPMDYRIQARIAAGYPVH